MTRQRPLKGRRPEQQVGYSWNLNSEDSVDAALVAGESKSNYVFSLEETAVKS